MHKDMLFSLLLALRPKVHLPILHSFRSTASHAYVSNFLRVIIVHTCSLSPICEKRVLRFPKGVAYGQIFG